MTLSRFWSVLGMLGFTASLAGSGAHASIPVEVSYAPASDLDLTIRAIQSAQQTLLVNIYELSSADIANALIQKIEAGVQVAILEEGQPVGGLSPAQTGIISQIAAAMRAAGGKNRIFEMTTTSAGPRRFRFDHAKYIVVDGSSLLIGSENYSPTGNPTPGTLGNRGWEVLIQDPTLANQFQTMFASDCDPTKPDIVDMTGTGQSINGSSNSANGFGDLTAKLDVASFMQPVDAKHGHHNGNGNGGVIPSPSNPPTPPHPAPDPIYNPSPVGNDVTEGIAQADAVGGFSSPTTSESSVLYLIQHASQTIDIEQMTFAQYWGSNESPILAALIQAAQRGVHVRVLLNDDSVFNQGSETPQNTQTNSVTVNYLNQAASQGLPIRGLIANVKAMGVDYIHNKGAIFDNNIVMVSSINWDQNSFQNNRETGVAIQGAQVAAFYENLFAGDWQVSGGNGAVVNTPVVVPTRKPVSNGGGGSSGGIPGYPFFPGLPTYPLPVFSGFPGMPTYPLPGYPGGFLGPLAVPNSGTRSGTHSGSHSGTRSEVADFIQPDTNQPDPDQASNPSQDSGAPLLPIQCPSMIAVSASIAELRLDSSSSDFASLSGKTLVGQFSLSQQESSAVACVFLTTAPGSVDSKTYFELHRQPNNDVLAVLEGYVPGTNALYSIHAKSDGLTFTTLPAQLYDGSGTHQLLGDAELSIESL